MVLAGFEANPATRNFKSGHLNGGTNMVNGSWERQLDQEGPKPPSPLLPGRVSPASAGLYLGRIGTSPIAGIRQTNIRDRNRKGREEAETNAAKTEHSTDHAGGPLRDNTRRDATYTRL
jgi:hypothetical protein